MLPHANLAGRVTWIPVHGELRKRVSACLLHALLCGAKGGLRFWPIKGSPRLFDLFSSLDRSDGDWEDRVVVAGADSESCFLALYIAGRGAEVHVVDPKSVFSDDKLSPGRDLLMMSLEALPTVHLRRETSIEEIGEGYVVLQKNGDYERLEGVGSVVIGGRVAENSLYERIVAELPDQNVYNIGDSVEPRDVYCASHEAANVAELIRLKIEWGGSKTMRTLA